MRPGDRTQSLTYGPARSHWVLPGGAPPPFLSGCPTQPLAPPLRFAVDGRRGRHGRRPLRLWYVMYKSGYFP
ncbi:Store-Operated Calcium Entry Regulator Stimate [Manis pentadactyla]|nr:Store-Operated Calcium Entry Regulator Stimate [Manis pentadactyla]